MSSEPPTWRATIDEAPTVAQLLVEFRDHNGGTWPSPNAFLASVERLIDRPDTEFLLAAPDRDTPPAGVCQLRYRFSIWVAAEDCWLEDLFVSERARGRGLGRALVAAAIARASQRGARRIELDTNEANAPAIALYESLGFSDRSKGGGTGRNLFMGRLLEDRP